MKNMKYKTLFFTIFLSLSFSACSDTEDVQVSYDKMKESQKKEKNLVFKYKENNLDSSKYENKMFEVFKDTASIAPSGKQMILVFGTNTDPYTLKLKKDIFENKEFANKLKNDFSSYYFKAHTNLRHKQYHNGEFMDVDTKTMISIYGIESTPTIIFTDLNAKAVIVVPGYMPAKQFIVTMNFMADGKWNGKNRKNGEVYEALRAYYILNGINVNKKDK